MNTTTNDPNTSGVTASNTVNPQFVFMAVIASAVFFLGLVVLADTVKRHNLIRRHHEAQLELALREQRTRAHEHTREREHEHERAREREVYSIESKSDSEESNMEFSLDEDPDTPTPSSTAIV